VKSVVTALALAALAWAAAPALAEDPAPAAPPADAAKLLTWVKDYDAAKAQAKKEGKGLFVYLTPDWFS
jgi:hypothetical protein